MKISGNRVRNERMNEQRHEWMDGQTDRQTEMITQIMFYTQLHLTNVNFTLPW